MSDGAVAWTMEEGPMAKTVPLVLLGAALFMRVTTALAASADFERVFPSDYRDMLFRAKNAYDGKRYDEAFHLFQKTACAGDKESQSAVGRMYLLGQGVTRDDFAGYAWLKVAAEVRFRGYQMIVQKLEQAMTPQQRAIADPEAAKLIDLYGLRATNMSCDAAASRRGHVIDSVICTPQRDGPQLLLRQCVAATPLAGG